MQGGIELRKWRGDDRADVRRRTGLPGEVEERRIDRPDLAIGRPDEQPVRDAIDRERLRSGNGNLDDERPGHEVIGADGPARDQPQAIPSPLRCRCPFVPAGLDDCGRDRYAKFARGRRSVVAPGDDSAGHRVLGEMRVGPFVDVVRDPVPPVLKELDRRPRVIDLVEVHLVRLAEAPDPDRQERHREDGHHPDVELVHPATGFAVQLAGSVPSDGPLVQAMSEPAEQADLAGRRALVPGGIGRRVIDHGRRRPGLGHRECWVLQLGEILGWVRLVGDGIVDVLPRLAPAGLRAGTTRGHLGGQSPRGPGTELQEREHEDGRLDGRGDRDDRE